MMKFYIEGYQVDVQDPAFYIEELPTIRDTITEAIDFAASDSYSSVLECDNEG